MSEETTSASTTPETSKPAAPVVTIAELGKHEGQSVTLHGWLYNSRESGKLLFPIFRDGTGTVQGVAHVRSVAAAVFDALKGLTQESSVIVTGKVRADQRAPGGFELDVEDVHVVQRVPESDPYPITPKEHGVDFLMEHRHLWVRSPRQSAILRIRAEIMRAAQEYFDSNGFCGRALAQLRARLVDPDDRVGQRLGIGGGGHVADLALVDELDRGVVGAGDDDAGVPRAAALITTSP